MSRARASRSAPAAPAKNCSWCCRATTPQKLQRAAQDVARDLRSISRPRQRHVDRESAAARNSDHAGFCARRGTRRHRRQHRRNGARRDRRRLRPGAAEIESARPAGRHSRAVAARSTPRPRDDRTDARAGSRRPGPAVERREGHDRQRSGADRPLRPQPQHQHRSGTRRPAARRSPASGRPAAVDRESAGRHSRKSTPATASA